MTVSETFSSIFLAVLYRRAKPQVPAVSFPPHDGGKLLKKMLAIAIPVSASSLAGNLIASANTVLVPQRLIASGMPQGQAVGVLGIVLGMAMPLFMLPMAFIGPLIMVMLPRLSEECTLGNTQGMHRKIGKALHATGLIALPCVAVMAPMGSTVCALLYGQVLPQGSFYLLAAASVFIYYQAVTTGILNGVGRQNTAMVNTIVGGIVQLSFTWFAVSDPRFGINGFLAGAITSSALSALLNMNCLIHRVGLRVQWARWFIMPALAAAVCGLAAVNVWIAAGSMNWGRLPAVLWSVAAGFVFYLACLRLQGIRLWRYLKSLVPNIGVRAPTSVNSFFY